MITHWNSLETGFKVMLFGLLIAGLGALITWTGAIIQIVSETRRGI